MTTADEMTIETRGDVLGVAPQEIALEVIRGRDRGRVFGLDALGRADVGRSEEARVCLVDTLVSRRHAEISFARGELRVVDLASKNGTFVNGIRVGAATLRGGELLRVGLTELRLRALGKPDREMTSGVNVDVIAEVIDGELGFSEARRRVLNAFEARYFRSVLAKHGGNVSRAAAASGIARRYFYAVRARVAV